MSVSESQSSSIPEQTSCFRVGVPIGICSGAGSEPFSQFVSNPICFPHLVLAYQSHPHLDPTTCFVTQEAGSNPDAYVPFQRTYILPTYIHRILKVSLERAQSKMRRKYSINLSGWRHRSCYNVKFLSILHTHSIIFDRKAIPPPFVRAGEGKSQMATSNAICRRRMLCANAKAYFHLLCSVMVIRVGKLRPCAFLYSNAKRRFLRGVVCW